MRFRTNMAGIGDFFSNVGQQITQATGGLTTFPPSASVSPQLNTSFGPASLQLAVYQPANPLGLGTGLVGGGGTPAPAPAPTPVAVAAVDPNFVPNLTQAKADADAGPSTQTMMYVAAGAVALGVGGLIAFKTLGRKRRR